MAPIVQPFFVPSFEFSSPTHLSLLFFPHQRYLGMITSPYTCVRSVHSNVNPIYVFPEKELRGSFPIFYIHGSVSDLYFPRIGPPIFLHQNRQTDHGNIKIAHRHMNVKIGTEATQFLFWEYINVIFVAVYRSHTCIGTKESYLNIVGYGETAMKEGRVG